MNPKLEAAWKKFQARIADIRRRAKAIADNTEEEKKQQRAEELRKNIRAL